MFKTWKQEWNSSFKNCEIEKNSIENSKVHRFSWFLINFFFFLCSLEMIWFGHLPKYFLLIQLVFFKSSGKLQNFFLELISFIYLKYSLIPENFFNNLGCFFPIFVLNFYTWKKWQNYLILVSLKCLALYPQITFAHAILIITNYTFLYHLFEKESRKIWAKMVKNKNSNTYFGNLWMKIPFPVILVSYQKKIIKKNTFAENFFPGTFDEIFSEENKRKIFECLEKSFRCEEKLKISMKINEKEFLVQVHTIVWKTENCVEMVFLKINHDELKVIQDMQSKNCKRIEKLWTYLESIHRSQSNINHGLLKRLKKFCVDNWVIETIFDLKNYSKKHDKKESAFHFTSEIINLIDFFNLNQASNDFRFKYDTLKSAFSIGNEAQVKLFLYLLIEFIVKHSDATTLIYLELKTNEKNDVISYELLFKFQPSPKYIEKVQNFFQRTSKNLNEGDCSLHENLFLKTFFNLSIKITEIRPTVNIFSVCFEIELTKSKSKYGFSFDGILQNKLILKNEVIWVKNSQSSNANKLRVSNESQMTLKPNQPQSIRIKISSMLNISLEDHFTKENNSEILTNSPMSLSSVQGLIFRHCSLIENRSLMMVKSKKSKRNHHEFPQYSYTNSRKIHKFLYEGAVKTLNFEVGVFKVLIVDDFEIYRKELQEKLQQVRPIHCEFAKDGTGALEMYENYAGSGYMYHAIFMDLIMPRLNGYKAAIRIREIERNKQFPRTFICAVSGDKDCVQKCKDSQIDEIRNF